MIEFELSIEINARHQKVWDELSDIAHHVEWMDDAEAIRFIGSQTFGNGTLFETDTKILFLKTVDRLKVTQWIDGHLITISHLGAVKGNGTLAIGSQGDMCLVTWTEEMTLPWYLGGVVGEHVAKSVLSRVWIQDLKSLKAKCEHADSVNPLEYFAVQNQRVITKRKRMRGSSASDPGNAMRGSSASDPGNAMRGSSASDPGNRGSIYVVDLGGVANYATGPSPFAARLAAVERWQSERS